MNAPAAYGSLLAEVREAGLLRRRHGYYAGVITANLAVFAGAWVAFAFLGDTWWQLLIAALLAAVFAQLAFVGHDAGHKQIFRTRRPNDAVGVVHGGLVGMSYQWWIDGHNRHHANPNHEEHDPDLDIPALAFTSRQARVKQGFLRWMAKNQAFLFFPLLTLEGLNLHVSGIRAVRRGETKMRRVEGVLLTAHIAGYLTAVFLVLSPGLAVTFVVVHQALWGVYMGCSFAPNHKGMPTMTGQPVDFLRRQVLTSRNIRGGKVVDFVLGGLNYQIEHHLFPNMPRPHLRRAQPIVERFCRSHGIPYAQTGLLHSYRQVLGHLHQLGAPLRAADHARSL
ncbi:acyl-CoA desaturase [Amycolatopsis rubida]|uniref:Acyl-CoA desaturase n=1 Tax=Amycolatopsis rubida TaxID=112413 RepID=A0ABX0BPD4_9PSEU|nr:MULTISPECIES: acyl-CoA desaturase [Amycolatopsis]MYW92372.1 acyl-CoA desaturase [Amycolatopsis rubida]MYW95101.1 acyl-CoA desaturase [Amycolatopsis rubida]NEC57360.1 acyl-CoA desaturase [Amycolatopsis rubida]NEC60088.1 acyl-CoA desaturase [Amycolatopsis rubida]OAP24973.1 Stearoyl-CoA 9-desaturase [Amycolatopsis sp. M39]